MQRVVVITLGIVVYLLVFWLYTKVVPNFKLYYTVGAIFSLSVVYLGTKLLNKIRLSKISTK